MWYRRRSKLRSLARRTIYPGHRAVLRVWAEVPVAVPYKEQALRRWTGPLIHDSHRLLSAQRVM